MPRMSMIDPALAVGETKALLDTIQAQLGQVPNLHRALANSAAALAGYLCFRSALVRGHLDEAMRERLALLVAEENRCEYCVSAHVFGGGRIGLSADELVMSRAATSGDPRTTAALQFARAVMWTKGAVSDDALAAVRAAGWSDGDISELVGHVALNLYSSYFNHVAQPTLDFPRAPPRAAADTLRPVVYAEGHAPPAFQKVVASAMPFDATVARLKEALAAENLWLVGEIDPQRLLEREGYRMEPARQLLYFHPRYMSRLLSANAHGVAEAPLKLVILQTPDAKVSVRSGDIVAQFSRYPGLEELGLELADLSARVIGSVQARS